MKVNYKQISLSKNRSINRQLKEVIYNDLIKLQEIKEDAKRLKYYEQNKENFKIVLN